MSSNPLWDGVREGCGTCSYAGPENQHQQRECRRFPPQVTVIRPAPFHGSSPDFEQLRPWVRTTDWCGEYKRSGA